MVDEVDLTLTLESYVQVEWSIYPQQFPGILLAKDRKKFIQLITLIKNGTDPKEAMKEAYGYASYAAFLKQWKKKVR